MKTTVMRSLEKAQVNYEPKTHSKPVYTAVEAAHERGVRLPQVVKTMIVQGQSGKIAAALIPGHKRLSLERLRHVLNEKEVALVSPDRVKELTGYEVGSVSPIGIRRRDVEILVDPEVLREEYVTISAGNPHAGLMLKSRDLARVVGAKLAAVTR